MESSKLYIHPEYNATFIVNEERWPSGSDACIIQLRRVKHN